MTKDTIYAEILKLSDHDISEITFKLIRRKNERSGLIHPDIKKRYNQIRKVLQDIVGRDVKEDINEEECAYYRCMICYMMKLDGYTIHDIAKTVSRHSTRVYGSINSMGDILMFPGAYKDKCELWEKFRKAVKNLDKK